MFGKFFIELMQIFGAITAVGNFDILGHTVVSLTCASCDFDKTLVHRHLDDVPTVARQILEIAKNLLKLTRKFAR